MHFKASDVFQYYKPSKCAKRVALLAQGVEPKEDKDPFAELLVDLGLRHERSHLATFEGVVDLSSRELSTSERGRRTLEAIRDGASAIYQAGFRAEVDLDGDTCELVGEPDFLIRQPHGGGYVIRDSKLARKPLSRDHAGIPLQLQIYGLLYERAVGMPPAALEVHAGTNELIPIEYRGAEFVLELLREHRRLRAADPDSYEPVGWSKCQGCGYNDRCWRAACESRDVAILSAVDQDLARDLHGRGVDTIPRLDAAFDDESLRDLFWQEATRKKPAQRTKTAIAIRRSLDAHMSGKPILISAPDLPAPHDCVTFDLEGLPAYADELQKIYLWGLKDFGTDTPQFMPALAGFGADGDRDAWQVFLRMAVSLLADRPNMRFVHWGSYETAAMARYAEIHGDPDAVAARVAERCVDLHQVFKRSVALPTPSYGLKRVGEYIGFQRRLANYGGDRAIARYIQAIETSDAALRAEILGEILDYNEEDLDATRAAMEWLRQLATGAET